MRVPHYDWSAAVRRAPRRGYGPDLTGRWKSSALVQLAKSIVTQMC